MPIGATMVLSEQADLVCVGELRAGQGERADLKSTENGVLTRTPLTTLLSNTACRLEYLVHSGGSLPLKQ